MHDTHFLERLERTSGAQTDLALSLYRDPELVRFILKRHAVDADRIAVALDDSPAPAHVVVARDGAFVTCLGSGMQHALPVLPRARLEYLSERHVDLKTRLAYSQTLQQSAQRKLWHAFMHAGHRLSREAFVALMPLAPLVLGQLTEMVVDIDIAFRDIVYKRGARLIERAGRWTSAEEEMLTKVWRGHWAVGHLLALRGTIDHEVLHSLAKLMPKQSGLVGWHGLRFGFLPVALRASWTNARHGPATLPALKGFLASANTLQVIAAASVLTTFGAMHGKYRAECAKALATATKDGAPGALVAWYRNRCANGLEGITPQPIDWFRDNIDFFRQRGPIWQSGGMALPRPRPLSLDEEALMYLRRMANLEIEMYHPDKAHVAALLLTATARMPVEDMYWTEEELAEIPRYQLENAVVILKAQLSTLTLAAVSDEEPAPRVPAVKVGRNDPCHCGSGKKYKRCCG